MNNTSIWKKTDLDCEAINRMSTDSMISHLGIRFVAIGADYITATMPVDKRTVQPHGRLHGGASVALAETVGSWAANLTLDNSEETAVGLEVNANHVRPAKTGMVYATARAERLGRSTQVWSIRIVDDQQRLVCVSLLTMAVITRDRA